MPVVVHVPGRYECRHIAGPEGAFISKAQLRPTVLMEDRVPPSGDPRDQRGEIFLVSGQLHEQLPHLVHNRGIVMAQFVQLNQEAAQWAGVSADGHLPTVILYRRGKGLIRGS